MLAGKREDIYIYEEEQPVQTPRSNKTHNNIRKKTVAVVSVIILLTMAFAVRNEMIIQSGYELVAVKSQLAKAEKENEQLHLDIARLHSPKRIQDIAVKQLGMVVPEHIYCAQQGSSAVNNAADKQMVPQGAAVQPGIVDNVLNFFKNSKI